MAADPFKSYSIDQELSPEERLRRLKAAKWPEEGKAERIAEARAAWDALPPPPRLTPAQWKKVAEDPDVEE